ncbi:MAG: DUF1080 domain-containing protein, partial [Puniceicoccales bacterium]|nr:DUF1080 domain-containing protein [Puniceicoccales bacterium]
MKPLSSTLFSLIGAVALTLAACTTGSQAGWTPLFNGKDLSGWVPRGGSDKFEVVNGEIVGTVGTSKLNSFLCTEKNYGDFVLELEFNCHADVNSGVQIRSEYVTANRVVTDLPPLPGVKNPKPARIRANHISGYQVEIEYRPGRTGGIYDEDRRNGWVYPEVNSEQDKTFRAQGKDPAVIKPGEWQKLRIEASGDTIKTFIDGVLRADAKDSASASGLIALQIHSAG